MKHLIPFFVLLLIVSCRPSQPDYVLSEDTMEDILVDYQIAIGMAETEDGDIDENRYVRVHRVFDKYGVTEEEFDSSMVFWCTHSEDFKSITQRVSARIKQKASSLGITQDGSSVSNTYAELSADGDTANIWNGSKSVLLTSVKGNNLYMFSIPADSSTMVGDTYMWAFVSDMLSSTAKKDVYAQLIIEYDNDSVLTSSRTIYSNGLIEVRNYLKAEYEHWKPRSVNGLIYLPSQEKKQCSLLILNQMALIRYHNHVESMVTDSIDSDSISADSISTEQLAPVRITPHEVRDEGTRERTIEVVKESKVKWVKRKKQK